MASGVPFDHVQTQRFVIHPDDPDVPAVVEAARMLRQGKLVAFPTETVYGLGADARSAAAVGRSFAAKGRPADNPLIVHVPDRQGVETIARAVPPIAERLMERFWPGPLTIVLPRQDDIPDVTTAGLHTVGVRAPAHPVAQALLRAAGVPVAAPSANRSGSPSPTTAQHVLDDLDGRIDAVVDAGPCMVGLESTVVRVEEDEILVLRLGAITEEMLGEHAPVRVHPAARDSRVSSGAAPSPGMKHRHYAPRVQVVLFEGHDQVERLRARLDEARRAGHKVAAIVTEESALSGDDVVVVASRADPGRYAQRLYATLRQLDAADLDQVLVEGVEARGIGAAIMDRLRRAAAG